MENFNCPCYIFLITLTDMCMQHGLHIFTAAMEGPSSLMLPFSARLASTAVSLIWAPSWGRCSEEHGVFLCFISSEPQTFQTNTQFSEPLDPQGTLVCPLD